LALEQVAVAQASTQRGGQVGERGWGRDVGNLPWLTQHRQPRPVVQVGSRAAERQSCRWMLTCRSLFPPPVTVARQGDGTWDEPPVCLGFASGPGQQAAGVGPT